MKERNKVKKKRIQKKTQMKHKKTIIDLFRRITIDNMFLYFVITHYKFIYF
jgi:hypothetical protein